MVEILILSWHVEDLHCKINEDGWALMQADFGETVCHLSSGRRPEARGRRTVRVGRLVSLAAGFCILKDGLADCWEGEGWDGLPVFLISCSERGHWCMMGAFPLTLGLGGSIEWELAELGRDLLNDKLLQTKNDFGSFSQALRHRGVT